MAILLLINMKGGVAKTTNAVAIAECFAASGHSTLLIDADHQCMAGELLLGEEGQLRSEHNRRTLHDLLAAMLDEGFSPAHFERYLCRPASNIAGGLEHLAVLPCSIRIDDFVTNMARARRGHNSNEEFLRQLTGRRRQLRNWAEEHFACTIIDCPPSLALQVRFFLSLADAYIVPCVPDRLSVRGCLYLQERIRARGYRLPALGTLWSLFRVQNPAHRMMVETAGTAEGPWRDIPRPFGTVLPNASRIAQAADSGGQPQSFRDKYGPEFARQYQELCAEIHLRAAALPAGKGVRAGGGSS